MGLFKPDFYRSFAIGFAVGAVIVFASLGVNFGQDLVGGVVPAAEAAAAR